MKKGSLFVVFVVLASTFFISVALLPNVKAITRYVGGLGPGNYTMIQSAIDDSNPGDTIYVYNRTYHEHIRIDRTLTLVGENRNKTIIDGDGSGAVVDISADSVNVSRFTITNGGTVGIRSAVELNYAQDCNISNNSLSLNIAFGLRLWFSDNNSIAGNTFYGNYGGIGVSHSNNNTIENNIVRNSTGINMGTGITLSSSSNNTITNNTFDSGRSYGIYVSLSDDNTITNNTALKNFELGISLHYSNDNLISHNNASGNRDGIRLVDSNGNTVRSNDIWQADFSAGIILYNSTNSTVVYNNVSDGTRGILLEYSQNNTVRGNNASWNGLGVELSLSDGNTIDGNNVSSNLNSGIFLDFSHENVIANNILRNDQIGMKLDSSSNNTIALNTISLNAVYGVNMDNSNDDLFANNSFSDNLNNFVLASSDRNRIIDNDLSDGNTGVSGHASHGNIIANNSIHSNGYGVYLLSSANNIVIDNALWNNSDGFYIHSSDFNTIAGNNASNGGRGVDMVNSRSNTITNNSFKTMYWDAVSIGDSISNTVRNNIMIEGGIVVWGDRLIHWNTHTIDTSNTLNGKPVYYWKDVDGGTVPPGAGQIILANCSNVRVEYQNMSNGSAGVLIGFSSNNMIVNNTLSSNLAGVYVNASSDNQIYHNNFINNSIYQAFDDGPWNQWDNGYPSGGNYWSDYGGVDNCSGPNQDVCPDPDGIGDTPYYEQWFVNDRYPLMYPFESVSPQPPRNLRATLSGEGLENVTLTWSLSFDDGTSLMSVTGYEIYRNTSYDSTGLGYQLIATLPNGTSDFIDSYTGEGDPESYFYTVCAVDLTSNRTCSPRQAAKFTRSLTVGPNLLSIPLVQSNESIERVLQTVKWDKAWSYKSSSREWKTYMKGKTYKGELLDMNHTMGLWVNVTEDSNLTVAGVVPTSTSIHMAKGWNLVSFPSFNEFYSVADLKVEVPVERVEAFDSSAPPHFLRVLADYDILLAGQGYWVKTSEDATWVVSNG